MNRVYSINRKQETTPFVRVHCTNEESELQDLLEKNLDLIPGEQVEPEDPRRWLLIKRELPVEDPGTGEGRWSLDFLLVDQDGVLTLVECKRFRDTRAKREVIGQMFDYAANSSFYLTPEIIEGYLQQQAAKRQVSVESLVAALDPTAGSAIKDFLDAIQNNIREGQLRLVFFMEEASHELRSIVEFLNRQMERTEVLLVEVKQFQQGETRVVVPTLWGYTEQARRIKKTLTIQKSGNRRVWNYEEFKRDLDSRLEEGAADAVLNFYEFVRQLEGMQAPRWGTGKERGSFSMIDPRLAQRSILTVFSDGQLWLNFEWLNGNESELAFREIYFSHARQIPELGLTSEQRTKSAGFPHEKWLPIRNKIERAIADARTEFLARSHQASAVNS